MSLDMDWSKININFEELSKESDSDIIKHFAAWQDVIENGKRRDAKYELCSKLNALGELSDEEFEKNFPKFK
jgi:hypothetical protein